MTKSGAEDTRVELCAEQRQLTAQCGERVPVGARDARDQALRCRRRRSYAIWVMRYSRASGVQ